MVPAVSTFPEDANNTAVSQNLSSCNRLHVRATSTGLAATQDFSFFFFNTYLLLGMTKYFLFWTLFLLAQIDFLGR